MALFFVPFRASFITGNFHSVILPAVFCLFFSFFLLLLLLLLLDKFSDA